MHKNILAAGSKDSPPMLGTKEIFTMEIHDFYGKLEVVLQFNNIQQLKCIEHDSREQRTLSWLKRSIIFLLLTGIGDEIYSTVDACNTANEMWIAIERLQQGESLNVQDVKTNLFWEFGKFTSRDGESMESYYSRRRDPENKLRGQRNAKEFGLIALYYRSSTNYHNKPSNFFNSGTRTEIPHQVRLVHTGMDHSALTARDLGIAKGIAEQSGVMIRLSQGKDDDHITALHGKIRIGFTEESVLWSRIRTRYLKKAQSDKPCLYEIPYDTSDPANRFAPDREGTMTLDNESRSKLNKDFVKPYDYTKQNSLYEIFKGPHLGILSVGKRKGQDLKAQMQDKNIAISELKKLIEKCKGKSVETQFDKPSVVRQPNAQRIPKPSVLGKPTPFSNSPEMRSFQTKQSVNKTNVSDGLFKQVTQQNLPQNRKQAEIHSNVLKPGMYRIATTTTQNREPQLPHASRNTNPHVSKSSGVNHTTSVSRPQLKCYQVKDKVVPNNSQVKFKKKEVEDHHRISNISKKTKSVTACNDSSNSRTSNVNAVCAECGKCVCNSNHDACVSRYLKDVNARTKKPKVVPISASKPKRKANKSVATPHKKTVASDTTIQKSKSYHKELYENTNQEWKWWIAKRCPSGYKWTQKPLRTKKIWMPKIRKEDVSTSISPTIDIVSRITNIVQLILFIVDSGCTKHMTGNLKLLCNFVEKFLGTVRFGNDQFAPILGYGDLNQGNVMIKRVYYVEGLNTIFPLSIR
ncbi:hypothetical protein Tco_1004489 [Tanacetum coccineum]|uniref:Retrovirus-related Pol polyprotein from transposon TNT 1-94-like beta-barrel domain-containing protein n=1 Tax=Tanacetum coccineum TaxID=301880 RepID=A0ABQ5FCG0_9ASTR